MSEVQRLHWRIDVGAALPLPGPHQVAVDLVLPARGHLGQPPVLLSCLPGGFLSRGYYDLEVDGSRSFSFAQRMAERGFCVAAFDHLGTGDSSRPDEQRGFELDVETLARAAGAALDPVLSRLRSGDGTGLPALPGLRSVGVGHSMGSCLSVVQQAVTPRHAALVLFSFTTAGLPEALTPEERRLAHDAAAIRSRATALARERFGSPWPEGTRGGEAEDAPHVAFQVGTAPEGAARALEKVATNVLALPGLLSMIPGAYAPYADRIDVPVFIAAGDHDIHTLHDVPGQFPRSPEATAYRVDDCWHCHFVSNRRRRLWDRTAHWLRGALC